MAKSMFLFRRPNTQKKPIEDKQEELTACSFKKKKTRKINVNENAYTSV